MKPKLNEKLLAYLTLVSGLLLSLISEYYSIVGLMAIFSAMPATIATMGVALGIAKIVSTLWLKQNWTIAPTSIKIYLSSAIIILMVITSLGCFGLLSKAHSDQSLVSGDVLAKIAVYDEKINTSKENIDANRKELKQMDEAVDQVMARSDSEKGADKAIAVRKSQAKERVRLLSGIAAEQKAIAGYSEERAPTAAEVRKVEAEVGPIKYIAAFVYGNTDPSILERAVTWVIILIIVVFDPLAVILLLSSQISFQNFRERELAFETEKLFSEINEWIDSGDALAEGDSPRGTTDVIDSEPPTVTTIPEEVDPILCNKCDTELVDAPGIGLYCPNKDCSALDDWALEDKHEIDDVPLAQIPEKVDEIDKTTSSLVSMVSADGEYVRINGQTYHRNSIPTNYVQNEEQKESNKWSNAVGAISREEYFKASNTKLEDHVDEIIELINTGKIQISELQEPLLTLVKTKL